MTVGPGFQPKTKTLVVPVLVLLFGFCLGAGGGKARIASEAGGGFRLRAARAPLWMVLTELQRRVGVEVVGLEDRHGQIIGLDARAGNAEGLLKRLLRHLGAHNFALEYRGGALARVSVFPSIAGGGEKAVVQTPGEDPDPASATAPVVRIQRVFAETQAEGAGLERGDFIIAYNGVLIRHHSELIVQTRQTAPEDQVELVIARDYGARRLTIEGGTIGIGIRTIRIFKEEYDMYVEAIP
jgi:hypothetical protein